MKIIPVIDLKDGLVVHAKHGERENYQPINTPLCSSAGLLDVLQAFWALSPFDTFYIADLNAIMRTGHHCEQLLSMMSLFPTVQFWVDAGLLKQLPIKTLPNNWLPVLGSESFTEQNLTELAALNKNFILSLDFSGSMQLGANSLFDNASYWPETVIIMTLAKVGSQTGPDVEKLAGYAGKYAQKTFVAAGGVRNAADLIALQDVGINQALVASALHSGQISNIDIAKFNTKKYPD